MPGKVLTYASLEGKGRVKKTEKKEKMQKF
jgi:hypothetical protein